MKITILGSGTSTGVPEIGCTCPTCVSTDPRDKRLRCSGLVEVDGVRILIDCGPDFREQMIRLNDFKAIDAVLVTHEHYDHVGGLDDLRPYCKFRDVPVYAEEYVAHRLRERIPYCFAEQLYPGVPRILLEEITPGIPFYVSNTEGQKVEITELSKFPSFYVEYRPEENIVIIQCSAGRLVLKKGIFFYGYSGTHKGLRITARAYVENGKLEQIVYEEYNEFNNVTASISYFKE